MSSKSFRVPERSTNSINSGCVRPSSSPTFHSQKETHTRRLSKGVARLHI